MERRTRAKHRVRQRHSSVASSLSDAVAGAGERDANVEANSTETSGAASSAQSASANPEGGRAPRKERKSSRRMNNSTSYSNYVPGAAPPPPPPGGRRSSSRARAPNGSDSSLERLPRTQSFEHMPFPFNPFAFRAPPMAPRPPPPFFQNASAPLSSRFAPAMSPFHPGFFPGAQFGGIPHFPASAPPFRPFGPPAPVSSLNPTTNASVVYVPVPVPVFCPPTSSAFIRHHPP